jgi:ubiquitin-protein ligase
MFRLQQKKTTEMKTYIQLYEEKITALAMSQHKRLGSSATISCLTDDVMKMIARKCSRFERLIDNEVTFSKAYLSRDSGVFLERKENELMELCGVINGPPDTSYARGVFFVDIQLRDDFPFKPPKFRFRTRIWHPNVDQHTGIVAIVDPSEWCPAGIRIAHLLILLSMWLADPIDRGVLNREAHKQRMVSRSTFENKAIEWTREFATRRPSPPHRTRQPEPPAAAHSG